MQEDAGFAEEGPGDDWMSGPEDGRPEAGDRRREVVGYLRGRGSRATNGPESSIAALRGEIRELVEGLDALLAEAERVEEAFLHVRRAFDRTQPPIFNRLTVRWWLAKAGQRRVPCLVQVQGDGKGREKPVRRFDRRVKQRKDGGFGLNADLAKEVFELYWALWSLRGEVQDDLSRIAAVLRARKKKPGRVERLAWEAVRIRAEATQRLRLVGFEFEEEAVPEWPLPEGFWGVDGEAAKVLAAGEAGEAEWKAVGVEVEGGDG